METTEQNLLGRLLDGRYRLDSVIARGGMATVYSATDERLDRGVAVKVMHRSLAEDPDFVARFTREARASARVQVPEVVAVHDTGRDDATGAAYLVMEHVRGQNLRQLLNARGPLSPARAVSVMTPVLRALAAAHAAGLVHRDVKPENVLLGDDGRVKVADFGLARAVETSNLTQTTGLLIGTVAYLAPEQVEKGTADARTDVYAAGVLLWELLTGTPPYGGDSPLSVAYKHVHEDVPAPSTAVAGIPPDLDAVVVSATRRDPDARPADGAAFLAALTAAAHDLPDTPPLVPAATEQQTLVVPRVPPSAGVGTPVRVKKRRRGLVLALVIALLAAVALGGGYYLGSFRYTKAPSVLGLTQAVATDRLEKAGFDVELGDGKFSEDVARGLVLEQSPEPGSRVRKDGTVELVVSRGKDRRTVPQLAGRTVQAATTALTSRGLVVSDTKVSEFSNDVAKDLVIRTDPGVGASLKPDAVVTLVVSKGPEPVEVPDVRGQDQDKATKALQGAGFQVSVTEAFSDEVAKGKVIDQTPHDGTAARGSTIALTVSKGPDVVSVPDARRKSPDDAAAIIRAAGLVPARFDVPGGSGSLVATQSPKPGSTVRRGTTVTLYVI